ncbi:methionine adenosyltransferase 2 subunit beta-like [Asterias amurensis]|uniref:methionine adenosyltransferase 2 subunit beta-like n=1 Tax=Asterias amurensis TaxID=7602 RepID=UPI003AB16B56
MPRVLITGASGLLGRALVKEFTKASWEVLGLAYSRAGGVLKKVDLTDSLAVRNVLTEYKPAVVVHSAAERSPDVVEKQEGVARKINVDASSLIASICDEIGAYMIYLSTDYVFDGKNAPYKPGDQPNPLNKYGQSKLDGEVAVQKHECSATLRVPVLYGDVEYLEESAITVLFKVLLDTSQPAAICDYQLRYPTHVQDIAAVCRQMADLYMKSPSAVKGIFHWSNDELVTKYSLMTMMADIFHVKSDHITAKKEPTGTPRPYNCQLDTTALSDLGIGQKTKLRESIESCLQPYFEK